MHLWTFKRRKKILKLENNRSFFILKSKIVLHFAEPQPKQGFSEIANTLRRRLAASETRVRSRQWAEKLAKTVIIPLYQ